MIDRDPSRRSRRRRNEDTTPPPQASGQGAGNDEPVEVQLARQGMRDPKKITKIMETRARLEEGATRTGKITSVRDERLFERTSMQHVEVRGFDTDRPDTIAAAKDVALADIHEQAALKKTKLNRKGSQRATIMLPFMAVVAFLGSKILDHKDHDTNPVRDRATATRDVDATTEHAGETQTETAQVELEQGNFEYPVAFEGVPPPPRGDVLMLRVVQLIPADREGVTLDENLNQSYASVIDAMQERAGHDLIVAPGTNQDLAIDPDQFHHGRLLELPRSLRQGGMLVAILEVRDHDGRVIARSNEEFRGGDDFRVPMGVRGHEWHMSAVHGE